MNGRTDSTALYFPILYRYITVYTTSTAQLHSELVRYRPTRNSAKAGLDAFSTSKKSSVAVCETVLASINHYNEFNQPRQWSEKI